MDPRTSLPERPERPARSIPWAYVWFGVLLLTVAAGVAWFTLGPRTLPTTTLNVPGGGAEDRGSGGDAGLNRAVAIARVDLERGVTTLVPERPGRVTAVLVRENDVVEKGQELVKIDDEMARRQVEEAETALETAQFREKQAKRLADQHADMVDAQQAKVALRQADVEAAQATVKRAQRGVDRREGMVKEDVTIAEKNVEKARRAVDAEQAELRRLQRIDPTLAVDAAKLDVKSKKQQLDKAKADLTRYTLLAPSKGRILRCTLTVGEVLGGGGNMMTKPAIEFWPDGEPLIIRAEVEQEYAGLVREGMKATVRDYDASGTAWQGEVVRVSGWISKRRGQVFEPREYNDVLTLETIIKLKEEPKTPLRIGQRVRVTLEGLN